MATSAAASKPIDPSIILHPNDIAAVPGILGEIVTRGVTALSPTGDDAARLALLESARALVRALEKPRETMIRHCWADNTAFAALSMGIEAGVWAHLGSDDEPKSVAAIAAATNMEEAWLARLLKHVAAMGYIHETGHDEYRPTNFSKALTIPILGAGYRVFTGPGNTGGLSKCVSTLVSYSKKTGYTTPNSMSDGNLQFAFDTKYNMFEWLHANPPGGEQFNLHMGGYAHGRPRWMDDGFYPVQERLLDGFVPAEESAALLVDIGGSMGHDLDGFLKKFPEVKGRLVLQDTEAVIGQITALDSRIERTVHDFFKEQPVKGARAYYMHSILHDWPDDVCLSILANIKAAMGPGSRLLINENVIQDIGAQWEATALDVMMASLLSSRERTRVDWSRLLEEGAGFKINGVYTFANGVESLIECVLPEAE
ncbi:S-adenosyl-L-methionine-dependent methyltransferase [Podospora appendiculata]|uniref:S-adenosyl-L-methionine-dependent methyltransferase n=1 Tax=Podospora appendiculata TaxID=314037 RepID=A0AAE0XHD1_9PEZI|nr:S-adenosyl-L-methionine-dependent methyltransferase [Podospora appendiculata]